MARKSTKQILPKRVIFIYADTIQNRTSGQTDRETERQQYKKRFKTMKNKHYKRFKSVSLYTHNGFRYRMYPYSEGQKKLYIKKIFIYINKLPLFLF